jgi:hypothetical protein
MRADGELGWRVGFGKWAKGQVSAQARFSLLFSFSFIFSFFFYFKFKLQINSRFKFPNFVASLYSDYIFNLNLPI